LDTFDIHGVSAVACTPVFKLPVAILSDVNTKPVLRPGNDLHQECDRRVSSRFRGAIHPESSRYYDILEMLHFLACSTHSLSILAAAAAATATVRQSPLWTATPTQRSVYAPCTRADHLVRN
jgi:hypothetical protein